VRPHGRPTTSPRIPLGPGRRSGSWQRREEADVTDTHDGRAGFGNRLRRLRENADLSGKQLAERLGWAASKVSRLENGRQTATAADVRAWGEALGLSDAAREELVDDLRSLRVEYATWRRQLRAGFAPRQRVSRLLDEGATTLWTLQTAVVPGLLQTADYARVVFHGLAALQGPRDVEAAVHERLRRQEVLYRPGRDFRFLLTEAAVRMRLCPAGVHRAQLDRLPVLAGLTSVRIAVLPWTAELSASPDHNFVLFDDRLVLVETTTAELAIREPDDIVLYARLFELYWEASVQGEQASALITRIALELPPA
jgi:transcriptional regulator with XRE-family HTH domain